MMVFQAAKTVEEGRRVAYVIFSDDPQWCRQALSLLSLSRHVFRFPMRDILARSCLEPASWTRSLRASFLGPSQQRISGTAISTPHVFAQIPVDTLGRCNGTPDPRVSCLYLCVCNILREQEWIKTLGKYVVIVTRGEAPDFVDMRVMSLCTHHIIANSSFSWWAAYLSRRQKRNDTSETTSWEEQKYHDADKGVVCFSPSESHAFVDAALFALMQVLPTPMQLPLHLKYFQGRGSRVYGYSPCSFRCTQHIVEMMSKFCLS